MEFAMRSLLSFSLAARRLHMTSQRKQEGYRAARIKLSLITPQKTGILIIGRFSIARRMMRLVFPMTTLPLKKRLTERGKNVPNIRVTARFFLSEILLFTRKAQTSCARPYRNIAIA